MVQLLKLPVPFNCGTVFKWRTVKDSGRLGTGLLSEAFRYPNCGKVQVLDWDRSPIETGHQYGII